MPFLNGTFVFANIMTGQGFPGGLGFLQSWTICWLAIALLAALTLVIRRQCIDGALSGTPFNLIGAASIGIVTVIIVAGLTADPLWVLIGGLAAIIIGGFFSGMIFGGDDDSGGEGFG